MLSTIAGLSLLGCGRVANSSNISNAPVPAVVGFTPISSKGNVKNLLEEAYIIPGDMSQVEKQFPKSSWFHTSDPLVGRTFRRIKPPGDYTSVFVIYEDERGSNPPKTRLIVRLTTKGENPEDIQKRNVMRQDIRLTHAFWEELKSGKTRKEDIARLESIANDPSRLAGPVALSYLGLAVGYKQYDAARYKRLIEDRLTSEPTSTPQMLVVRYLASTPTDGESLWAEGQDFQKEDLGFSAFNDHERQYVTKAIQSNLFGDRVLGATLLVAKKGLGPEAKKWVFGILAAKKKPANKDEKAFWEAINRIIIARNP